MEQQQERVNAKMSPAMLRRMRILHKAGKITSLSDALRRAINECIAAETPLGRELKEVWDRETPCS